MWLMMTDAMKNGYLSGYLDLLTYSSMHKRDLASSNKFHTDHWARNAIVSDYVKELDGLYQDGENVPMPIPVAMEYCTLKLNGGLTKAQLEQALIRIRQLVSDW